MIQICEQEMVKKGSILKWKCDERSGMLELMKAVLHNEYTYTLDFGYAWNSNVEYVARKSIVETERKLLQH